MSLVFIVDRDFSIINSVSVWLRSKGYDVRAFSGSLPLFEGLKTVVPDIILMAVKLGTEDGRQVCKDIRSRYKDEIPIVLFSMDHDSIKDLKDSCADDFIKKDATLHNITKLLQEHMKFEEEDV